MTTHGDQNFFSDARNIVISGGTFTNMKSPSSKRHGFKLLLRNISKGAIYNAAERGDPPRCHPQTRKAIRAEIMEWVTAPRGMRKLVLWMYGPAGSGKTAIAQSIAEECARLGLLAASFFFWRTAAGRNDTSRFVATLAYQLSRYIPQMEEHLLTVIERDPTIFSLSLSTQMRVLVVDPLKLAAPSFSTAMFAIVDGVDECGPPDGQSQAELLRLLASLVSELQHLPLIFLIASRPEYQIRKAFTADVKPLTKVLVLDNDYKPDEDIKLYFDSTFRDICDEHLQLGRNLPSPWPTTDDVDSLVSKASGQFIFASTVTKFIDSPRHNPADRMKIILRLSTSGNETPFALLDALYRSVLDSVADVEKILDILALLLLGAHVYKLGEAEELLGIEFRSTLIDMHSLLCIPPPSNTDAWLPTVYHASLEDFLMDQSRSRQYYIGRGEGHLRLSRYCLKAMRRYPHFEHLTLRNIVAGYCQQAKELPANESLANDLAQLDLRSVLECIPDHQYQCDLYGVDWHKFFDGAKKLLGSDRLENDFDMFIRERISQYPPLLQTHIPALLSLPCDADVYHLPELFRILLLGASNSGAEYTELLNLDKKLLTIDEAADAEDDFEWELSTLFKDKSRAKECFVDGESFVALAKALVFVLYPQPGKRNHNYRIRCLRYELDVEVVCDLDVEVGCDPTIRMHASFLIMNDILDRASTDWELANILRERAVQYRSDVEAIQGRRTFADASIEYIKRCGIPFLEHSHQPHMNRCAICECCEDATVVEDTSLAAEPPSPFPSTEDIGEPSSDSESEAHESSDSQSEAHELSDSESEAHEPSDSESEAHESSDSESEAHDLKASDAPSVLHDEGGTTQIPSTFRLPPISEWYESESSATTSTRQSTFCSPSRTQFSSSSRSLPSISEWYQNNDTVSAPQSKRKRVDTFVGPADPPAYRLEGSEASDERPEDIVRE